MCTSPHAYLVKRTIFFCTIIIMPHSTCSKPVCTFHVPFSAVLAYCIVFAEKKATFMTGLSNGGTHIITGGATAEQKLLQLPFTCLWVVCALTNYTHNIWFWCCVGNGIAELTKSFENIANTTELVSYKQEWYHWSKYTTAKHIAISPPCFDELQKI